MDDTDRRLGEILDEARHLDPALPPFDRVRHRAHRRVLARRVGAGAVATFFAATVLVAAGVGDEEADTRVAVSPVTITEDTTATTTISVPGPTTTTAARSSPPAARTTAEPRPTERPSEPSTTSSSTTRTQPPSAPESAPPPAYIRGDGNEVAMATGSTCWRPEGPGRAGYCNDTTDAFADDAGPVAVATGGTLVVRWAIEQQPSEVRAFAWNRSDRRERATIEATAANPSQLVVGLQPGEYVLMVSSLWKQGDVLHGVRLTVTPSAS